MPAPQVVNQMVVVSQYATSPSDFLIIVGPNRLRDNVSPLSSPCRFNPRQKHPRPNKPSKVSSNTTLERYFSPTRQSNDNSNAGTPIQKKKWIKISANMEIGSDIERIQKEPKESSVSSDGLKRSQETTEPHSPQLARFAMELSKAQEEVHGLSCERAALIRAHKEADQEVKRLLEDTKTLQAQLALFEQEGKESQRITENHKNEIEALQNNIFALKTLLEDEKKLSLSLTDEKEAIDTLFRKELEAKTALTAQTLQLGKDLENKNALLNTREERINFLETALSELEKEHQESEKRLKETEELLVLKISYLDSLEEQMEQLKENLLTNEEDRKAIEKEKTILSLNLEEELKKGLLLKERNESISKDLEESRQATLQTSRRLSLLEGWKRRTDQSLNQVKNSLENLYEYEKQLEHETSCHKENMNFPVDSSFFKPMTRDHGSLF